MKKVISIVGARPQFIKHAPMQLELSKKFNAITIHTGQHYDPNMSDIFFNELGICNPEYKFNLQGYTSHGQQTAQMILEIEKVFFEEKPHAVLVYGDTNSTLAATIAAVKLQIPIIHIEAGLRSYNRNMPEEINRIVADEFASLLFCPNKDAVSNLKDEGIIHDGIHVCGDVMVDMIKIVESKIKRLVDFPYYFATIHRPYNTDNNRLIKIIEELNMVDKKVIFSLHPRTKGRLILLGLKLERFKNIIFIDSVSYINSLSYQKFADCVITDSGGIQKEAYILKTKCITIRSETEWKETTRNGWNTLVYNNLEDLASLLTTIPGEHDPLLYGNGDAAAHITEEISKFLA